MNKDSAPRISDIPSPIRSPYDGVDEAAGLFSCRAGRRTLFQATTLERLFIEAAVAGTVAGGSAVLAAVAYTACESWTQFAAFGLATTSGWLAGLAIKTCFEAVRSYQDRATAISRYQRATIHFWKGKAEECGSERESALPFAGEADRGLGQHTSPAADTPNVIRPAIWQV